MASLSTRPPSQPYQPTAPASAAPSSSRPRRANTPRAAANDDEPYAESEADGSEAPITSSTKAFERPQSEEQQRIAAGNEGRNTDPDTLWETHMMAPSPSQTYWQIMVLSDRKVVLRDWPRKRFSTKWTRDGAINPGETTIAFADVHEHEERLKSIFGDTVWEKLCELCGIQT